MSVQTNLDETFDAEALAKLASVISVIEALAPGTANYLVTVAALVADEWTIRAQVNHPDSARITLREFKSWLYQEDPGSSGQEPPVNNNNILF